jgi:hypothetical protein
MRRVYDFNGNGSPVTQQAGLTFNDSGLTIPTNNYSVEMVFEFTDTTRNNTWRRILDVQNRQSDTGLYVDPSNNLDVFPISGSSGLFTTNVFHNVVLTDSGGTVNAYLDGALQFTTTTTVMDINNPGNLVNFFLDNTAGGGQGEFSSGKIALVKLFSGALTATEVANETSNPFSTAVPEPSTVVGAATGLLLVLVYARRRHRVAVA